MSAPTKHKNMEDHITDAVCATARTGWKVTKFVAPKVGRVVWKITGRAAKAAASTDAAKKVGNMAVDTLAKAASPEGIGKIFVQWFFGAFK